MEVPAIMIGADPSHGIGTSPHFPDELHFPGPTDPRIMARRAKALTMVSDRALEQKRLLEPFWGKAL
jgi:hypothetical protein